MLIRLRFGELWGMRRLPFVTVHGSGTAWFGEGARVTSIERTAYPQFKRLTSARVLHVFFAPTAEEIAWARERTKEPAALFALVLDLKCFQKMARFCSREEIPDVVAGHVRRCLGLEADVDPDHGAPRTAKLHRKQVRARQGVKYDMRRARAGALGLCGRELALGAGPPGRSVRGRAGDSRAKRPVTNPGYP